MWIRELLLTRWGLCSSCLPDWWCMIMLQGGSATDNEMCLSYLHYYPKINMSSCLSQPNIDTLFKPLGVENIYNLDKEWWAHIGHQNNVEKKIIVRLLVINLNILQPWAFLRYSIRLVSFYSIDFKYEDKIIRVYYMR